MRRSSRQPSPQRDRHVAKKSPKASPVILQSWPATVGGAGVFAYCGIASAPGVLRLVRPSGLDANIFGLIRAQLRELDPDLGEVKARYLFVQRFRQHVNLLL